MFSKHKALETQVNGAGWAPPLTPADRDVIETGMGLFGLYHLALARRHILAHLAVIPGHTTVFYLLRLQQRGHTLGPSPGAQLSPAARLNHTIMMSPSHFPCGQHGLIVTAYPHPCTWLTSTLGAQDRDNTFGQCQQVPGLLPALLPGHHASACGPCHL